MSREIELKILLDEAAERRLRASPALRRLRGEGRAVTRQLVSVYYDTPGHALAAAGIALRLRKVGRVWVQTVKRGRPAMVAGLSTPEEQEAPAPGGRLDLGLIADAELRAAVAAAAGGAPLGPVFETRMARTAQALSLPGGRVELAIDAGEVVAGSARAPLREAELELLEGDPSALFEAARLLFPEGPIRFSARSKAARGYALAAGLDAVEEAAPRKARAVPIAPDDSAEQAGRAILSECLDQIAANMAVVASTDAPEGPHQLRIGLRRLRAALALLKPALGGPALESLSARARDLGALVGGLRDLDVLRTGLVAALGEGPDVAALDGALAARQAARREEVRAGLAGRAATAFLHDLGAFVAARGWLAPGDYGQTARLGQPASALCAAALDKAWKRAAKLGRRIARLSVEERHDLRKALKKLRYILEFSEPCFPEDASARFIALLRQLQDSFGAMNDVAMAEAVLTVPDAPGADDPAAQRAAGRVLGWHGHASLADWAGARRGWQRLAKAGPFWR